MMSRYFLGIVALCATFFAGATGYAVNTERDGLYYFEELRTSILEVLAENQALINQTPRGDVKNPKLEPDAIYREMYQTFKTIMGKDFNMKELAGQTDPEHIASALTALLQGARDTIARLQNDINQNADGTLTLKKFIPAVFGRLTLEKYQARTGIAMKQTTLGKSGHGVRNPYNAPSDWESDALARFSAPDWELNAGYGVVSGQEYRYVKPLYIKKGCLPCHGLPVGEKDPYGHPKEGYQEGEVRGGISVILPLSP